MNRCFVSPPQEAAREASSRGSEDISRRSPVTCAAPQGLSLRSKVHLKMNKVNVALLFAALMIVGACAAPRKLLITGESKELADAEEHARILVELEEIHALRDRMLAEAATYDVVSTSAAGAPAPGPA